jgi:uncharacterized protein (DUF302 family)
MIQVNSTLRFEDVGSAITSAAVHHGAAVLAVTDLGRMFHPDRRARAHDAKVYTLCHPELYSVLLAADIRFAALLPCRVAALRQPTGVTFEALSPRKFCDEIHRPDLDRLVSPLEELLRSIMQDAASPSRPAHGAVAHGSASPGATEQQMNMRGAIPQRIDCHGTKVEDLAGDGKLDAPGG